MAPANKELLQQHLASVLDYCVNSFLNENKSYIYGHRMATEIGLTEIETFVATKILEANDLINVNYQLGSKSTMITGVTGAGYEQHALGDFTLQPSPISIDASIGEVNVDVEQLVNISSSKNVQVGDDNVIVDSGFSIDEVLQLFRSIEDALSDEAIPKDDALFIQREIDSTKHLLADSKTPLSKIREKVNTIAVKAAPYASLAALSLELSKYM